MWIINDEQGESWNGNYFRDKIIPKVFRFVTNERNVVSVDSVVFLHDKAPGFTANATQECLRFGPIDFFNKSEYPGNSADLNVAEHVGAILKQRTEDLMVAEEGINRYSKETLIGHMTTVLKSLERDMDLFESLLLSYPARLKEVVNKNGGDTSY